MGTSPSAVRFLPLRALIAVLLAFLCLIRAGSAMADAAALPDSTGSSTSGHGRPGLRATVIGDLGGLVRARTLEILALGAAAAVASKTVEDPNRMTKLLGSGLIDDTSDFGNVYGSGGTLIAVSGAMFALGHFTHKPMLSSTGFEMARALIYTGVAVTGMKVAFHRTRPNGGPYSFPSGHTAMAFAVAPILAKQFGGASFVPAYLLATTTAMGRLEDRKHFLSDVVFGAAVGLSVGLAVSHRADGARSTEFQLGPGGAALTHRF